ncbi:hypothetical protein [Leptolyngbya iicbica]|nr:hypothetical protein [Leptolyngbya sp. LK]
MSSIQNSGYTSARAQRRNRHAKLYRPSQRGTPARTRGAGTR